MIEDFKNKIIQGDTLEVLKQLPDDTFDTIITSPPYWGLRDYGVEGQIGLEKTLDEFIEKLLAITQELQRVLKPTGVMWWNHGDCYGGNITAPNSPKWGKRNPYKDWSRKRARNRVPKCLCLQNYRLILRMIDDQGWILRNTIIWSKPNAMPSSVKDRFANSYEPVFMLVKNKKYWFDLDAVRAPYTEPMNRWGGEMKRNPINEKLDPCGKANANSLARNRDMRPNKAGKNPGDVWRIPTHPFPEAHFATFPEKLVEPMILSGCPFEGGIVLDPFMGSGTVGKVAKRLGRDYCGIELNPEYVKIAKQRIRGQIRPLL